ncbi:hypothetical protein [Vulcanisaeta sp. JCM 16161]|uniref:hypothetical protein n=1 Tax=Vulcanisaeta sp. JCM 16161 TaxID=1295372 RepID=UPI001FB2A39C|nr:hypothetical protein [Vulcanisaeta sp. JCM 16161]
MPRTWITLGIRYLFLDWLHCLVCLLVSIKPMVIKALVVDEELTITAMPVVLKVLKYENNYSIWVNVLVSTKINEPRPGPQCNPVIVMGRPAKAERIEVVNDGVLRLKLGDGSEKEVIIKPTNISFYPDYRDQFCSPCIVLNWSVFWR